MIINNVSDSYFVFVNVDKVLLLLHNVGRNVQS